MNLPTAKPSFTKPASPVAAPQSASVASPATAPPVASPSTGTDSVVAPPVAPEPPKAPSVDAEAARRAADQRAWERRKAQEGQEAGRRKADLDRREAELNRVQQEILSRMETPAAPRKALPPEIQEVIDAQARELAELKEWRTQQMRERQQAQSHQTYEQALNAIEAQAKTNAATPTVAELAKQDPKRFRAACTRIAREDPTLQDDEILGMVEDELSFYGSLRRTPPRTEETAAPSAPTIPAKPPSGPATEFPAAGAVRANNLANMRALEKKRTEDALAALRAKREASKRPKV